MPSVTRDHVYAANSDGHMRACPRTHVHEERRLYSSVAAPQMARRPLRTENPHSADVVHWRQRTEDPSTTDAERQLLLQPSKLSYMRNGLFHDREVDGSIRPTLPLVQKTPRGNTQNKGKLYLGEYTKHWEKVQGEYTEQRGNNGKMLILALEL